MIVLVASTLLPGSSAFAEEAGRFRAEDRIQPYAQNPRYWQYRGRPVILLGGSKDDNLFQIPDLGTHLEQLASAGGNYVRNTMSMRDEGNLQPFTRTAEGRYDLDRWNAAYWRRLDELLRRSHELDIIVQIEVWDRFDFSGDPWRRHAFNPANNVNYTREQSGLAAQYPEHPLKNLQPFFFTTPTQQNNTVVLRYQQRFVDELLRHTLPYPNVLYCIDNETSGDERWSTYWADYIRSRAQVLRQRVYITEMWDPWKLQAPLHRHTLDHPERYDFGEVSQNNHQSGDAHWQNLMWAWSYVAPKPRPLNAVKTYGADLPQRKESSVFSFEGIRALIDRLTVRDASPRFGTTRDGLERWWRSLVGGAAAVRFHRPPAGIGLDATAARQLQSARAFLRELDITRADPDATHTLLSERETNEAYVTRVGDEAYALYFPDGGSVALRASFEPDLELRWLDVSTSRWSAGSIRRENGVIRLDTPSSGHWVALLKRRSPVSESTDR